MAQIIFPHRTAPPDAVRADPWCRILPGGALEPVEEHISDFDAGTVLRFVRTVRVDGEALRRKCELLAGDRLAAVAQWFSGRTEMRGAGKPTPLAADEDEVEVKVEIAQGHSGGTLVLRTCVMLDVPAPGARAPFSPALAGAIVWQERKDVVLEGTGPRFPVEIRKFASPQLSAMGWMLDWRPGSPEAMFMGSVRLLLNEQHKAVVDAAMAVKRDRSQKMIVSAINVDVARSLVGGMLRNPEFTAGGVRYLKGTVGQVVGDLIASTFPGDNLETVRAQLENEPETFSARVQSRFRLFNVD
jgi:hypothetical protein